MEECADDPENKSGFDLLSTYCMDGLKCSVQKYVIGLYIHKVSNNVIVTLQMGKPKIRMVMCMFTKEKVIKWSNKISNLGVFFFVS